MGYIFPSIKGTRCRSKTSPGISSGGGRFRFLGDQRPGGQTTDSSILHLEQIGMPILLKNGYTKKTTKELGILVHTPLKVSVTIISTYFISTLPAPRNIQWTKNASSCPKPFWSQGAQSHSQPCTLTMVAGELMGALGSGWRLKGRQKGTGRISNLFLFCLLELSGIKTRM